MTEARAGRAGDGEVPVGKIIAFESVTLDGVTQAPGRPDEDARGGFAYGGWAAPYTDEVIAGLAAEHGASTEALLFGRRTYEDFYGFWPRQPDNPFTQILEATPKYVASTTLREPLPWANSALVESTSAIADVKGSVRGDIVMLGSGELARALVRDDLIDEYVLLVHPLVLGTGRRLFGADGPVRKMELVATRTSTTGVIIATYRADRDDRRRPR